MNKRLLKLPSGIVVDADTGKTAVNEDINEAFTIDTVNRDRKPTNKFEGASRRFLDDLRMPPIQSRAYMVILAYSLFGLSDADIGSILKISADDVRSYRDTKEYATLLDGILQNVRDHDRDKVRKKLNKAASSAADTIVSLMNDEDPAIQLRAAQDILNRNGLAADVASGSKDDTGIVIRILNDKTTKADVDIGGM